MTEKSWIKRAERYADLLKESKKLDRGRQHIGDFIQLTETEKLKIWSTLTKDRIKRG